jgi:hypothetical protein
MFVTVLKSPSSPVALVPGRFVAPPGTTPASTRSSVFIEDDLAMQKALVG